MYGSRVKAIMSIYPEHDWKLWKFGRISEEFWKDMNHQRLFFDQLGEILNISKPTVILFRNFTEISLGLVSYQPGKH
jgi:hypothetical protein